MEPAEAGDPTPAADVREQHLLASVMLHSPDAYVLVSGDGHVTWASPQIEALLGYAPASLTGRSVEELVPAERRAGHARIRAGFLASEDRAMGAGRYLDVVAADGTIRPCDIRLSQFDEDRVLVVLRDATDRKALEDGLRELAGSDPLTGLANRRVVMGHIEGALARTRRRGGWMALCYIDLDRFKPINDEHGHEAGDQVLLAVTGALRGAVRDGDLVGRIGGDEFVIVQEELGPDRREAEARAAQIAWRALAAIERPIRYAGLLLEPGASIGLTVSEGDGDGDDLLRSADAALYEAKDRGGGVVVVSGRRP